MAITYDDVEERLSMCDHVIEAAEGTMMTSALTPLEEYWKHVRIRGYKGKIFIISDLNA